MGNKHTEELTPAVAFATALATDSAQALPSPQALPPWVV